MKKIVLTIAGLDPSGGAGIVADVKTIEAFGCYAAAVVTSITFQNTQEVRGAESQTAETVSKQLTAVLDDISVDAVKTGMLPTRDVIETVVETASRYPLPFFVVDPVVRSTSGFDLIDDEALRLLVKDLFPIATIVTPNIPEAERISGIAIESDQDLIDAAKFMLDLGAPNVLIKGGHRISGDTKATDHLFHASERISFDGEYFETTATHGTGCTLSSAIAANLALGKSLEDAVRIAKEFVAAAIRTAPMIGKGNSPINIDRYLAIGKNGGD